MLCENRAAFRIQISFKIKAIIFNQTQIKRLFKWQYTLTFNCLN